MSNRLIESITSVTAELAARFAADLTEAIIGSLNESSTSELIETLGTGPRAHSSRPAARTSRRPASKPGVPRKAKAKGKTAKSGRLPRRSPEQITEAIGDVIRLLVKNPEGLRSEQIRAELNLDKREVPRLLQQGVADGALKILHGEKRSTTYGLGKGGKKKAAPKKAAKKTKKPPVKKPTKKPAKKKAAPKKAKPKAAKRAPKKASAKKSASSASERPLAA